MLRIHFFLFVTKGINNHNHQNSRFTHTQKICSLSLLSRARPVVTFGPSSQPHLPQLAKDDSILYNHGCKVFTVTWYSYYVIYLTFICRNPWVSYSHDKRGWQKMQQDWELSPDQVSFSLCVRWIFKSTILQAIINLVTNTQRLHHVETDSRTSYFPSRNSTTQGEARTFCVCLSIVLVCVTTNA